MFPVEGQGGWAARERYARGLFGAAAAFNISVAISGWFFFPHIADLLSIRIGDANAAYWRWLFMTLVFTFGVAYALAAVDHRRFRPYVVLGIIGKSLVVATCALAVQAGIVGAGSLVVASGDVLFALLFLDFLRRCPA